MASSQSSGQKRSSTTTKKRAPAKRSTASRSSGGAASNGRKTTSAAKRSTASRSRPATSSSTNSNSNGNGGGAVDTVKHTASKAAGPALAVGAAAAGLAGGILLKSRKRRKTVLGVPMPRSLGKGVPAVDPKAVAKTVGQASKRFAKTTKSVSKDLERAGDQAERIGKILD